MTTKVPNSVRKGKRPILLIQDLEEFKHRRDQIKGYLLDCGPDGYDHAKMIDSVLDAISTANSDMVNAQSIGLLNDLKNLFIYSYLIDQVEYVKSQLCPDT